MCISNNFSTRQYVSDVITKEEVDKWKIQDKILITAGTGTGKTYFCKTILSNITRKSNKKILIVSNRTLLKEQIRQDTFKDRDIIDVVSYQAIEERYIQSAGNLSEDLYSEYLFIFFDEFHYVYSDSEFRMETEYTMFMIEAIKNSIMIFATATPQILYMDDRLDFAYKYELDYFYSNIKKITLFRSTKDMIEIFSKNTNGKSMFFFSSVENALYAKNSTNNCGFIVSKNSNKSIYNTTSDYETIKWKNKFKKQKIATTKVLDNGVNIVDKDFNKIFIDIFDPIEIEQCIGRKRFLSEDDYLNVFIKCPNIPYIKRMRDAIQSQIEDYEKRICVPLEDYTSSYLVLKQTSTMTPDYKPRKCYYLYLLYKRDLYTQYMEYKSYNEYDYGYFDEASTTHCLQHWLDRNPNAEILYYSKVVRQKRVYELLKQYDGLQMLNSYLRTRLLSELREAYVPRNGMRFEAMSATKVNDILKILGLPITFCSARKKISVVIRDGKRGLILGFDDSIMDKDKSINQKYYYFKYDDKDFVLQYDVLLSL